VKIKCRRLRSKFVKHDFSILSFLFMWFSVTQNGVCKNSNKKKMKSIKWELAFGK